MSENEKIDPADDAELAAESEDAATEYYGAAGRRRGANSDRRGSRNLWLVSYSDFMTILMIFFLAMYGYTYLLKTRLAGQQARLGSAAAFDAIVDKMKDELGGGLSVEEKEGKTTLRIDDKVLFVSGRAALNPDAMKHMEEIAASLNLVDGDVIVEGHTDSVPVSGGRFRSNWELSAARAFSVIQALTANGVKAERLSAWGFGQNRPRADNGTAEGRSQNRRIEIVILKKSQA